MIIILLFVLIIAMIGIKKAEKDNYLSKNQTNAIKGIMAIIIFLSHFNSQITLGDNTINSIYKLFFRIIDQNMVAIFLFYSFLELLIKIWLQFSCFTLDMEFMFHILIKRIILKHFLKREY